MKDCCGVTIRVLGLTRLILLYLEFRVPSGLSTVVHSTIERVQAHKPGCCGVILFNSLLLWSQVLCS